jgi:hypothetical protein
MKNEQKQQAKHLYFQTDMSKTEIAGRLGLNRRTIMLWCQEGNWDRLKQSSRHLPSMVAEKCYYLLDQLASYHLSEAAVMSTFSSKDADAINKLASSIKKLKNRNAVNESMEMFNYFLDGINRKDPELAAQVLPYIEEHISSRKDVTTNDFLPQDFNPNGTIKYSDKQLREQWQDDRDTEAYIEELQKANNDPGLALESWLSPSPDSQQPETPINEAASKNNHIP